MEEIFKRTLATIMAVLILLTGVPLSELIGMDWSCFDFGVNAHAVEEGLLSVATVQQTAYGVLDKDVEATKVTLGDGYHLNSNFVDRDNQWDNYGEGYVLVEDDAGTTFYLVGTKGIVKSFYSDSGEKPKITLINEYSIDTPYALYSVYNPETKKYDLYNANTCQYYEYALDSVSSFANEDEYAKNIFLAKKEGKYGLINNKGQMLYSPIYKKIYTYKNCFIASYVGEDAGVDYAVLSNKGVTSGTKLYDDYLIYDNILFAVSDIEPGETWDKDDKMDWALVNTDLTLMTDFVYYDVKIAEFDGVYYRVCSTCYEETDAYGDIEYYYRHRVISDNGKIWDVCENFKCTSSSVGIYNSSVAVCENGLRIYITDNYGYYAKNGAGWINPDLVAPDFNIRYILAKPNGETIFNVLVTDENLDETKDRWFSIQGVYGNCECRKVSQYLSKFYDSKGNLISEVNLSNMNVMGNYLVYDNYSSPEESFIYDYVNEKMMIDNIYIDSVEPKGNGVCFAESKNSGKWAIFDITTGKHTDYLVSADSLYVTDEGYITNGKRKLWICYDGDKYIYVNDKGVIISTAKDDDGIGCLLKSGDYLIKSISYERGFYDDTYQVEIVDYDGKVKKSFNRKLYSNYGEADVYVSTDSSGNKYGLTSQSGTIIIDNIVKGVGTCYNGLTYVVNGDYAAVVDNIGNALMYAKFDIKDYDHSFNFVGASGFASFVKDNEVYIYDFTACNGFDKNTDSSVVTEDHLFGEYNAFLNNGFYNSLIDTAGIQVSNVLSQYGDNAKAIAYAKSLLDGQSGYFVEKLVDYISDSSLNETKLKEEMALEYLNSLNTESAGEYLGKLAEANGIASKINNADKLEYALNTGKSKLKFVEIWTDGTGFTSSEIYKVIEETKKYQDRFDVYFEKTGRTVKILDYVSSYLTIYLLQRELVESLMDLIPSDSELYEGLNSIYLKQCKSGTVVSLVEEMITDEVLNAVADLVEKGFMKLIGAKNTTNVASLIFYVGGKILSTTIEGPKLEDIDKAILAYANMITLKTAVNNYRKTIADNYSNGGGISVDTLKSKYSLICDTYYKSIFTALKYAKNIALDDEKIIIAKQTEELEKKLIYRSYIKTCLLNARAQWEYTVKANKVIITNLKAEYPSGEGRIPYMELYNSSFNVKEEMGKTAYPFEYAIDIPTTIDGYQVSAVGTASFSENNRVTGVYVPDTVTEIQDSAFKNCSQINTVYLGSSVKSIGDNAFENCNNLSLVDIPDSVDTVGENSFAGVDNLLVTGSDQELLGNIVSDNVTTQIRDLLATKLEIINPASKKEFKMQEEIDTSGLVVRVTYADGSTKDVTEGFYADIRNRVVGENTVVVSYEGLVAEYSVNILASECNYILVYQDEQGNEISDSVTGTATAGSIFEFESPEISGYIPVNEMQKEVIGYSNVFVVKYTEKPKTSIDSAIVTVENQEFAHKNLTPDVKVELDGTILTQGRDFSVFYADNYYVGTALVVVVGEGNYVGMLTANFEIVEKNHTHNYETTTIKQPTCITTGSKTFTCSCGDTYTETIEKLEHTPGEWESAEGGKKVRKCIVCSTVIEEKTLISIKGSSTTVNYKSTVTLYLDTENISEDANIVWKSDNAKTKLVPSADGTSCEVTFLQKGDIAISAEITDADGITVSSNLVVKVNYAWWQWIIVIVLFGWIWY